MIIFINTTFYLYDIDTNPFANINKECVYYAYSIRTERTLRREKILVHTTSKKTLHNTQQIDIKFVNTGKEKKTENLKISLLAYNNPLAGSHMISADETTNNFEQVNLLQSYLILLLNGVVY